MLSDAEEAEMDRARSSGFRNGGDDGHSDDGRYGENHTGGSEHDGEEEGGDEGLILRGGRSGGSSGYDSRSRLMSDQHDHARSFGRRGDEGFENGRQQAPQGFARNTFDFSAMEEFAGKDRVGGLDTVGAAWIPGKDTEGVRRRSGAGGSEENVSTGGGSGGGVGQVQPPVPGSYSTTMDRTMTMSAYGDDHDHEHEEEDGSHRDNGDHFKRRRQRKLSASNSAVRRPGKLAIFEGFGAQSTQIPTIDETQGSLASAGVLKAPRQPKNLKTQAQPEGFQPFTDAPPGHDRPYRFSFYSNALPVTIHARSLAELPAEGQTFEDLFKGKNNATTNAEAANDGVGTEYGSVGTGFGGHMMRRGGSDTPKTVDQGDTAKASLLARAVTGKPGGDGAKGADEDPEAFTWWLDVLSPTDEEMRMLSKVRTPGM
jgi:magnesium transporter